MQRYELIEGQSAKFWEVDVQGHLLTVRFGRIGTNGQTQTKTLADAAAAQKELAKLLKEKTGKGYAAVGGASPGTLAAVAPKLTAAPTPAPTAVPAPVQAAVPASVAPDPVADTQAVAAISPATLDWPQGGLQMTAFGGVDMPVVRGGHCPAWILPLGLLDHPPTLKNATSSWNAARLQALAQAGGYSWASWSIERARVLLGRTHLSRAESAFWLEACAQCWAHGVANNHADVWLTQASIHWRGLEPTLDLLLDFERLWRAAGPTWQDETRFMDAYKVLRHAIAAASDADYAAVFARAERERLSSPAVMVQMAYLFPHHQPWVDEALALNHPQGWLWLNDCWMSVPQLHAHARRRGRYRLFSPASILLHLSRHGTDLMPWLGEMLTQASERYEREPVLKWIEALRCPAQLTILVQAMEASKETRAALEKLAEQYPTAALYTAIGHSLSTRSRLVQGWALRLGSRYPQALAQAVAALEPAQAQAWQQVMQRLTWDEAPPEALPELLRQPPWLHRQRPQALPTLELTLLPMEERIDWPAAEVERLRKRRVSGWIKNQLHHAKYTDRSKASVVLDLLHIRPERHAAIIAAEPVRTQDFKAQGYSYYVHPDLLLELDADLALRVWNSYPAHRWSSYCDSDEPRTPLAHYGNAALPGFVAYCENRPVDGLPLALPIDAPGLARVALHALCNHKKAKDSAQRWVLAHLRTTTIVALQQALGRDKAGRDSGAFGLRWLMRQGHEALVEQVAAEYGGEVPAALALLKAADPLNVLPARMPKLPTFFAPATFTRPLLCDGRALPLPAVEHIGSMLAISKIDAPYVGLEIVREHCQGDSLAEFAWDLFQAWLVADAPSKEGWAFTALGLLGNNETVRRLTPLIREWPGQSAHARAVTGLDLLAVIGTDLALMNLNAIANKVKFKGLQDKAREKIALVAETRGLTTEELADRLVPDLGLDEQGALTLDFGPRQFTVAFDETLRPFVRDAQGARLKDLPKPIKSDDAALAATATERYKALKKDAKAIASMQITRLELGMVNQRRWSASDFGLFFVQHPLMRFLSARLVWGVYQEGVLTDAFRVAEDGTLADRHDDLYTLADDATVGIAHVLELPADLQADFGQVLADYEILQPFAQLGREVYSLTEEELRNNEVKRFAGKTVAAGSIMGLVNRGWQRGEAQDGGWVGWFSKTVNGGLQLEAALEPGLVVGDISFEPKQAVQSLSLCRTNLWNGGDKQPLAQLNPITASEMLRDIDLLAPYQEGK